MGFSQFSLAEPLTRALSELAYSDATAIQQRAIPAILAGQDVLAAAQTGTGKTASFALPLLQQLLNTDPMAKHCLALVLTPTRELAEQVSRSFNQYGQFTGLSLVAAYGGLSIRPQVQALANGAHVLVATPGRLLDLVISGALSLSACQILVLDEADRMLDLGFKDELQRILKRLPEQRQTLFFSATFPKQVKDFAYQMLKSPTLIEVSPENSVVQVIDQRQYSLDANRKANALAYLIGKNNWQQVLVFARMKEQCDKLVAELAKDGLPAQALHGDKSQAARQRALDAFKTGQLRILVATDVASRGLDIKELPVVVNFELPHQPEDYVHRIGRTGRAGQPGLAVSLVARNEESMLEQIERLSGERLPLSWLSGFEPTAEPCVAAPKQKRLAQQAKAKARAQAGYGVKKAK